MRKRRKQEEEHVSDLRPRPEADVLLVRRMVVLNLDRNEVAPAEPSAFQELQRL